MEHRGSAGRRQPRDKLGTGEQLAVEQRLEDGGQS
jgi:hypothetical protein